MRVLLLSPTLRDTAPGMRFRMEQWLPYLERDGFEFTYVPFEDPELHRILYQPGHYLKKGWLTLAALSRRLRLVARVRQFDLVYLFREAAILGPAVVERLIARRGVPLVYDFDDPIWIPYKSPTNRFFSRLKFTGKTAAICRQARVVLVGNRLLEGWAKQHSDHVCVVPSTVETDRYTPGPARPAGAAATLGWTGSHSTLPFLEPLKPVLVRLAERRRFRLLVISHTDQYSIPHAPYEVVSRKWQADTEAADLQPVDIGLGPFPDGGWTPWRCHGKVLQYMAAGIPTVASRIGILPDYIRDGEEGFLVNTEAEWLEKLTFLLDNPRLRAEMGAKARRRVEELYSARVWAPRVANILRSAAGRTSGATP